MEIQKFISQKRELIFDSFALIEGSGINSLRMVRSIANRVGLVYDCYYLADQNALSDKVVFSCRILYEHANRRILVDCSQMPQGNPPAQAMLYFHKALDLEEQLNVAYMLEG